MYRSVERFVYGPGHPRFRAWLWGVTKHKLLDHHRRLRDQAVAAGGTDAHIRLEQHADAVREQSDLDLLGPVARQMLLLLKSQFRENTWMAFWKVVIEDMCPADAAASLNMTVGAVYTARSRVLARLRQELSAESGFAVPSDLPSSD